MTGYTDDDVTAFIADAVASVGVKGEAAEAMKRLLRATHDWSAARALREAADAIETTHGTPVPAVAFCVAELRARAEQVDP